MEYTQKIAEPHGRLIKYALNFRYILINLSEYNFEKLKIPLPARAILGISQKIWYLEEEEIFKDYIRAIADLFSAENNAALLQKIFVYLYSVHTIEPIETRKRIEAVIAEKGDVAMSTAELLIERGIEKGIEKGIERGVEKNKLETARRMLDKGLSLNDILEITALSLDDLRAAGLISADWAFIVEVNTPMRLRFVNIVTVLTNNHLWLRHSVQQVFTNEEENIAAQFLREKGFIVLNRNNRSYGAEIDLLCTRKEDEAYYIFEVKKVARQRGLAYPRISQKQLSRLRKAAQRMQEKSDKFLTVRLCLLVVDKAAQRVEMFEDI